MTTTDIPTLEDVLTARARLGRDVHRTPLLRSTLLSERAGGPVYLKCENLQRSGSFKIRGALNAVRSLGPEKERGVVTFSSGNHGQGLALAAKIEGIRALICMPTTTPKAKIDAARGYGAEVRFAGTTSDHRKAAAEEASRNEGWVIVPPFDDARIVAGQATVGLEIGEDLESVDVVLVPTGGGGLLAGTALAVTSKRRETKVYAVEPETGNSMGQALAAGHPVEIAPPKSIADGLLPLAVGEVPFAVAKDRAAGAVVVTDDAIEEAMRFLLTRAKLVVEPSGAAGVAALLSGKVKLDGRTCAVVLSGGNVDPALLAKLFA